MVLVPNTSNAVIGRTAVNGKSRGKGSWQQPATAVQPQMMTYAQMPQQVPMMTMPAVFPQHLATPGQSPGGQQMGAQRGQLGGSLRDVTGQGAAQVMQMLASPGQMAAQNSQATDMPQQQQQHQHPMQMQMQQGVPGQPMIQMPQMPQMQAPQQYQQQAEPGSVYEAWAQQVEQQQQLAAQQQQSQPKEQHRARYSATEAKRGRGRLWIPGDSMTGTQASGANPASPGMAAQVKDPAEGYGQIRFDWAGVHLQGWNAQALIDSTLAWEAQPKGGCRTLVVAVTPAEAEAMAANPDGNEACSAVILRLSPSNRNRFLTAFGGVHWDELEERHWMQMAESLKAYCRKQELTCALSWRQALEGSSGTDSGPDDTDPAVMEARIQAEVVRRMEDLKQREAFHTAQAAARLTGGAAPMDTTEEDAASRPTTAVPADDWLTPTQPDRQSRRPKKSPGKASARVNRKVHYPATQDLLSTTTEGSGSEEAPTMSMESPLQASPPRWVKGLPKAPGNNSWHSEAPRPWQSTPGHPSGSRTPRQSHCLNTSSGS